MTLFIFTPLQEKKYKLIGFTTTSDKKYTNEELEIAEKFMDVALPFINKSGVTEVLLCSSLQNNTTNQISTVCANTYLSSLGDHTINIKPVFYSGTTEEFYRYTDKELDTLFRENRFERKDARKFHRDYNITYTNYESTFFSSPVKEAFLNSLLSGRGDILTILQQQEAYAEPYKIRNEDELDKRKARAEQYIKENNTNINISKEISDVIS